MTTPQDSSRCGLAPLSRAERRLFADYLWDSPKDMFAGALLGCALGGLLFSFWLAFTRLHVYGFWGRLKEDLIYLDAFTFLLALFGTALLGNRDSKPAAFWGVCAVMCALFALVSGIFGRPPYPNALGFFLVFHVGPVLVYGFATFLLYLSAGSIMGFWWLCVFLPVGLLGPAILVLRPPDTPCSPTALAAVAVLWIAAVAIRRFLFRARFSRPDDKHYRRHLRGARSRNRLFEGRRL